MAQFGIPIDLLNEKLNKRNGMCKTSASFKVVVEDADLWLSEEIIAFTCRLKKLEKQKNKIYKDFMVKIDRFHKPKSKADLFIETFQETRSITRPV